MLGMQEARHLGGRTHGFAPPTSRRNICKLAGSLNPGGDSDTGFILGTKTSAIAWAPGEAKHTLTGVIPQSPPFAFINKESSF